MIFSRAIHQAPSCHLAGCALLNSCSVRSLVFAFLAPEGKIQGFSWRSRIENFCASVSLAAMNSSPSHVYALVTILR